MKALLFFCSPRLLVPLAFFGTALLSQAAPKCNDISEDVRKAITSDPAKTLMIVEDALVINEACACEIVRAAIEASKADANLKQQIVQTALAVAPKMAPAITECAGVQGNVPAVVSAGTAEPTYDEVTDSGKSGKSGKSVLPILPSAPVEEVEEFSYIPRDIRGIYLIAPGGVGIIGERSVEKVCEDEKDHNGGGDGDKPRHRRRITSPISRSIATN
jgi:hypothetical protein